MKLYATTTSDKQGREAKKGGERFIKTTLTRGNKQIGTLELFEIADGSGYRLYWVKPGETFDSSKGYRGLEIHNSDNDTRIA